MKLLRDFLRARLTVRHAPHARRSNRRVWHVTVPAPRVHADA